MSNIIIDHHYSIQDISQDDWQELSFHSPFTQYEFLKALETSHCVNANTNAELEKSQKLILDTGWHSFFISAYQDNDNKQNLSKKLIAVLPLYIKTNSYGEYVFDWQWADAYHKYGHQYYPKLVNAIPFTPASSHKLLFHHSLDEKMQQSVANKLINYTLEIAKQQNFSSLHSLFIRQQDLSIIQLWQQQNPQWREHLSFRNDIQYQFQNDQYQNFDEFIQSLQNKKRKNIRQERKSIAQQQVDIQMIEGEDLNHRDWQLFYQCYQTTIQSHFSRAYLNFDFFQTLANTMKENIVMAKASRMNSLEPIAYALFFKNKDYLYGRYWGALEDIKNLHFELCYYQAIDYCISHGIAKFEAGAQGQHKLSRGLLATQTLSAHWILNKEFALAIKNYSEEESQQIGLYEMMLKQHSPFKDKQNKI